MAARTRALAGTLAAAAAAYRAEDAALAGTAPAMTAPLADAPRLHAIAAWDVPRVRRATGALAGTAERLLSWRARLEAVGRAVESGECWSGPAARSTVAALAEVAAVGFAVGSAVAAAAVDFERLAAEAGRAQDLAEQALAASAVQPARRPRRRGRAAARGPRSAAAEDAGAALAGPRRPRRVRARRLR